MRHRVPGSRARSSRATAGRAGGHQPHRPSQLIATRSRSGLNFRLLHQKACILPALLPSVSAADLCMTVLSWRRSIMPRCLHEHQRATPQGPFERTIAQERRKRVHHEVAACAVQQRNQLCMPWPAYSDTLVRSGCSGASVGPCHMGLDTAAHAHSKRRKKQRAPLRGNGGDPRPSSSKGIRTQWHMIHASGRGLTRCAHCNQLQPAASQVSPCRAELLKGTTKERCSRWRAARTKLITPARCVRGAGCAGAVELVTAALTLRRHQSWLSLAEHSGATCHGVAQLRSRRGWTCTHGGRGSR